MASSQALILRNPDSYKVAGNTQDKSRPERGRWTLVFKAFLTPSPGRTLDRLYTTLGDVLEKHANRAAHGLGFGPHVVARKIKDYFGSGEERLQQLELLRNSAPAKLEKLCLRLMKYTLRTESANTQHQAFKDIVELSTLFPGLRALFLRTKCLEAPISIDTLSALWNRSTRCSDEDWTFWKNFAATSLTDTTISAVLATSSVSEWSNCQEEGLSVIERLLVEGDSSGALRYSSALCTRYLAGVLDLPGFWRNMGKVHSYVANKLCCKMVQVLKDIGADILTLGPLDEPEPPFDYDGVDFLAAALLTGLSGWFQKLDQKYWTVQPWHEGFRDLLRLLRGPRAAELLPHSSACASGNFEDIFPVVRRDAELNILVHCDNETENPNAFHNHSVESVNHGNDSTISVYSRALNEDDAHSSDSSPEHGGDGRLQGSATDSLESPNQAGIFSTVDESSDDFIREPHDLTSHVYDGQQSETGPHLGQSAGLYGALNGQVPQHVPISPRLETLRKQAYDQRITLLHKQRELGDDHSDTLFALANLASTHKKLGEYRAARDLWIVVLEKQRLLFGEDDPGTLGTIGALGEVYKELGQLKKAEELKLSVLEKQRGLLGDKHPVTLGAMGALAATYLELGHFVKAKDLLAVVLDKQREVLTEDHPDTLLTMRNLGWATGRSGNLEEAEKFFNVVLEKQRGLGGEDNPNTLDVMGELASLYHELGQLKRAEELKLVVLEKRRRLLGEDHSHTLWTMYSLGVTYHQLRQFKKAEGLLGVALDKQLRNLGEDHRGTLRMMGSLASTYQGLGQFKNAEGLLNLALNKQRENLGEDHPDTLWTMGLLAWTYHDQGQFERAEGLHVVVLERRRKILGDVHLATRWARRGLALTYRKLGKLQDAEKLESLLEHQEVLNRLRFFSY
ncbi:High osmolarity signaling protein SHO1 [Mycena venus]|uniref:High osmolarity signaling protein SHO1 n=1 Tax=Mycena venus TaxID=2733690 RepID=A0A8H7DAR0_9AGAR|nr:High osmolarity signaling protein SHO1 [Mycena venus]